MSTMLSCLRCCALLTISLGIASSIAAQEPTPADVRLAQLEQQQVQLAATLRQLQEAQAKALSATAVPPPTPNAIKQTFVARCKAVGLKTLATMTFDAQGKVLTFTCR